jgi:hypothetical protein
LGSITGRKLQSGLSAKRPVQLDQFGSDAPTDLNPEDLTALKCTLVNPR